MSVDLEALRERYRAERDKRLRPDGVEQYIEPSGAFGYFVEDPYVEKIDRDPIRRECEAVIVGGGFGGILTAAKLKDAGIEDFIVIEKGGGFGGTWYWNRYPGIACDMKSYVYLPLLEETAYMPPRNYASGEEIRAHADRIVSQWGLLQHGLFQTGVVAAEWQEDRARWRISTDRGDVIEARWLVTAHGPMSKPKLPGIPGINTFQGHSFHTSRWDYGYTGGSADGGLTGLAGKRVAIIGTGATAIQCVPFLAEHAASLHVIQRTPSGIDARAEQSTDPDWAAGLRPGWHQELMDNFNILTSGGAAEADLIDDGWTFLFTKIQSAAKQAGAGSGDPLTDFLNAAELADAEKMEEIRARVDLVVKDPATAESLKPWYRRFCKRPVFHDGYLETFNRDNVTLIDTQGRGVDEITETGFRIGDTHHAVDCIIFASGFEVGTDFARRAGYDIAGRDGRSLHAVWSEEFATLHGMHVHGFPNLFIHQTAQGALPANFCHGLLESAKSIAAIISHARASGATTAEVTAEAQAEWVEHCKAVSSIQMGFFERCTPGYYNLEGKLTVEAAQGFGYGAGPAVFFRLVDEWRSNGAFAGLTCSAPDFAAVD